MTRPIVFTTFFLMLFSWNAFSATYFVASSGSDNNTGLSPNKALKSLNKASSKVRNGDTLLLRRGDKWVRQSLRIDKNNVTVGAFVNGKGNALPIIDSAKDRLGNWAGTVHVTGDNVTVKDMDIRNAGGIGLKFESVKKGRADNVHIDWTYHHGLQVQKSTGVTIENSSVSMHNSGWKYHNAKVWGNGIAITSSKNAIVRKNKVQRGFGEGIDAFYGSSDVLIEDNVVYANRAIGIYVDAAQRVTIQRNIVLGTSERLFYRDSNGVGGGIVLNNEKYQYQKYGGNLSNSFVTRDIKVLNNLIAGTNAGITIWGQYEASNFQNIVIAHNIAIDNEMQIAVTADRFSGSGNKLWNNAFMATSSKNAMVGGKKGTPFNKKSNYWSVKPHAAFVANGDVVGGSSLAKKSGWRSIPNINAVSYKHFIPSGSLTSKGYKLSGVTTDYLKRAISSGRPSIGAFSGSGGGVTPPPSPVSPPAEPSGLKVQ